MFARTMLSALPTALVALALSLLAPFGGAAQLCAPLKNVIASGDAFTAIRGADLHPNDAFYRSVNMQDWASLIELPRSSATTITELGGEAMFTAVFGTWAFADMFALSPQQREEIDSQFKALKADVLACLPGWARAKDVEWQIVLIGPTHALELAVLDADGQHFSQRSNEAAVMKLRVRRKAAVQRLLQP